MPELVILGGGENQDSTENRAQLSQDWWVTSALCNPPAIQSQFHLFCKPKEGQLLSFYKSLNGHDLFLFSL